MTGEGAEEFHYRLVPGEGKETLLLLHGTGGDESDLLPLGRAVSPGAQLLGVRGRVLENGMPRFFRRLSEGVFDEEDLKARTIELAAFVRRATSRHGIDGASIDALGYSNGANIAASLLLLQPGLLRRGVLLRAMLPLQPETLPDLRGTRVLIAAGRQDAMIPQDGTLALERVLRDSGADVTVRWAQGGHGLLSDELPAVKDWLAQN